MGLEWRVKTFFPTNYYYFFLGGVANFRGDIPPPLKGPAGNLAQLCTIIAVSAYSLVNDVEVVSIVTLVYHMFFWLDLSTQRERRYF